MRKILVILFCLLLVAQSCKYHPYLNYYITSKQTHFPHFTKWEQFVGSNSNPLRTCYNITCYDWKVSVHPESKKINASMKIYFRMEADQDTIMLDLQKQMRIDSVTCNIPLKKWKRKKDVLFFVFEKDVQKGKNVILDITYHGTPVKILGYSSIYWRKDKNNKPWICTSTQGIGPEHMMPCKML